MISYDTMTSKWQPKQLTFHVVRRKKNKGDYVVIGEGNEAFRI